MSSDRDVRAIAKAAYEFGYAVVENYRTMHAQAIDANDPRYTGGFGKYRHYAEPARPENTDIVTPNNDTPYSWLWLDLRAEPYVVSVPAIDRYYILPFHDLYTVYAGFVGAVTTGADAGNYLLAGPAWSGDIPDDVDGVIRCATDFVGSLTRTALMPDGIEAMKAVQNSYHVQRLSDFAKTSAPNRIPEPRWPAWDEKKFTATIAFYELLDFLLQFAPPLDEDKEIRRTMSAIGLHGNGTFTTDTLDDADRTALARGLADGIDELEQQTSRAASSIGLFGTHEQMAGKYPLRNIGAAKGIYGLPANEAWYGGWLRDTDGNLPTGTKDFTVTFTEEALPQVKFFWSATMYRLPERLLVANPIDRYSIGDRTSDLVYDENGSLTLHISHTPPQHAGGKTNWLPAPEGPFTVIVRAYGGNADIANGTYTLPPLVRRS